jgi:hypothetical protein
MCSILERIKQIFLSCVEAVREKEEPYRRAQYRVKTVWDRLAAENKHELIAKLRRVENGKAGYGTIIVPAGGWSKNESTTDAVMAWLKVRDINVYSPAKEIVELEQALHGNKSV